MLHIFNKNKKSFIRFKTQKVPKVYEQYAKMNQNEVLIQLKTSIDGLSTTKAESLLEQNGLNIVVKNEKQTWYYFFFMALIDPFILVLLALVFVSFLLSDKLGAFIILVLASVSFMIRFIQEFSSDRLDQKLKSQLYTSTTVRRDHKEKVVHVEDIVVGDIIEVNAGAIIPADVRILTCKDLFINQSIFTGESVPVEKEENQGLELSSCLDIKNIILMGTSVVSGSATCVIIQTSFDTYLGKISKEIDTKKGVTNFEIGMKNITKTLIQYMIVVVLIVFFIHGILKNNIIEALFFSISVAVVITPGMLPMIVNINLAKGSRTLSKKKVLVKKWIRFKI